MVSASVTLAVLCVSTVAVLQQRSTRVELVGHIVKANSSARLTPCHSRPAPATDCQQERRRHLRHREARGKTDRPPHTRQTARWRSWPWGRLSRGEANPRGTKRSEADCHLGSLDPELTPALALLFSCAWEQARPIR